MVKLVKVKDGKVARIGSVHQIVGLEGRIKVVRTIPPCLTHPEGLIEGYPYEIGPITPGWTFTPSELGLTWT